MVNKENKYYIDAKEKKYFVSCLLAELFINHKKTFPLILFGEDEYLEEYLIHMVNNELLDIDGTNYAPTEKCMQLLKDHKSKLIEFRSLYKLYSAVDTGEGEFGYSSYFDFDTDEQFEEFISQDNFEDLRVAICEFKGINPIEVIFLEMIDEGRFDLESNGWQFELTSGLIWDEMVEIANTNIRLNDLAEEETEDSDAFTGEEVMKIIIKSGNDLLKDLIEQEDEMQEESEEPEEGITEETIEITIEEPYYDSEYFSLYYTDPYYYSPVWGVVYY